MHVDVACWDREGVRVREAERRRVVVKVAVAEGSQDGLIEGLAEALEVRVREREWELGRQGHPAGRGFPAGRANVSNRVPDGRV